MNLEHIDALGKTVLLKNGLPMMIRPLMPADAEAYASYMRTVCGESDNLTFCPEDLKNTPEKTRELIADFYDDGRSVMLAGIIDGEISAVSTLKCMERKRIRHNAEFSITVLKKFWQIGAGNALLRVIIDFARSQGDIRTIELGVKATNAAAIHLYEKHGFEKIGVHKNFLRLDDRYCDSWSMELYL